MFKKPTTLIAIILMLILSACIVAYANLVQSPKSCCAEKMQDCHQNKDLMPGQMLWETVSGQFSF
jgi:hypothetical protein